MGRYIILKKGKKIIKPNTKEIGTLYRKFNITNKCSSNSRNNMYKINDIYILICKDYKLKTFRKYEEYDNSIRPCII